jgi:uncharacterized protein
MSSAPEDAASALRGRLAEDLRGAMKSRDRIGVTAIRSLMGSLDNAGAVPAVAQPVWKPAEVTEVPRRVLTPQECTAIVLEEITGRRVAAAEYETLGEAAEAERLRAEILALERYLV